MLLKDKNQKTYENLLKIIIIKCIEYNLYPDPKNIHIDFEKSLRNVIKSVLGTHIIINGCLYHLTQNIHRMVQKPGLEQIYREDESFSQFCRKLDGIFLPLNYVKDSYKGYNTK